MASGTSGYAALPRAAQWARAHAVTADRGGDQSGTIPHLSPHHIFPQRRLGSMSRPIGDGIDYLERHGCQPSLARRRDMKRSPIHLVIPDLIRDPASSVRQQQAGSPSSCGGGKAAGPRIAGCRQSNILTGEIAVTLHLFRFLVPAWSMSGVSP